MKSNKTGYCNGSDMLLYIAGKPVGHCTSHSVTMSSDTKDHTVKAVASKNCESALWKGKSVTALSISISAEGLGFYEETETGYRSLVAAWKTGKSVEVKCMEREESDKPYLAGKFVISSLERTDPAQDDSTYSISLENDGEPDVLDESAITENAQPLES